MYTQFLHYIAENIIHFKCMDTHSDTHSLLCIHFTLAHVNGDILWFLDGAEHIVDTFSSSLSFSTQYTAH